MLSAVDIGSLTNRVIALALVAGTAVASAAALTALPKPAAPHSAFDRPTHLAPRPVDVADRVVPSSFRLHEVRCNAPVSDSLRCWVGTSPSTRG